MGKDVAVQAKVDGDYITIGCAVGCSFEFSNELIGKTDVNAGLFRKKRVRISDCRGSVQGIMISESTPLRLSIFHFLQEGIMRSNIDMRFIFTDESGNDKVISGIFLVSTISLTSDISAFVDFDLNLEGTGGIDVSSIALPGDLVCDEFFSDTWSLEEGAFSVSGAGAGNVNGYLFAGKTIIAVYRESLQHNQAIGAPGNMEYSYDGTNITFQNAGNPAGPNLESIFVIFMDS